MYNWFTLKKKKRGGGIFDYKEFNYKDLLEDILF